ncbi:amidase [Streptosporangium carneum]|uniref:Amidase n=1 Tax=Streptosporangium carneum TaxID=47481 RepID=A0A9W6I4P9_9ACTN|nr:amidase [Streptosporangium carneum]GLK11159.1 amidase [Streptosporangium carneum]
MRSSIATPLRRTAIVAALASACLAAPLAAHADEAPPTSATALGQGVDLERVTILDLQQAMDGKRLTSEQLTRTYLQRIHQLNPRLGAVVTVNPDAVALARRSDAVRRSGKARGPLEGIPVLLKDNMDTADRQPTTAGSTALLGARPAKDAFLVKRLREAGAVILGKANMTQWANFRSSATIAGWSSTGGQTHNPYVLDRSPCGSSSGSAAAAAAGLAAVTIGTDTGGSIVCPASMTSTVGVKPTLGLVSRTGIVPITARHDSPGPIARNTTDAALTLWAIYGPDAADPDSAQTAGKLPADYRTVLKRDALRGKRIGVWRTGHTGIDPDVDRVFEATVKQLQALGATVVEGVDVPTAKNPAEHLYPAVLNEFKHDLNAYLAATPGTHPKTLTGLIAYNNKHAKIELAKFNQDIFEMADKTTGDLSDPAYREHRAIVTTQARRSIDEALAKYRLDAIVSPTELPAPKVDYQGGGKDAEAFVGTSDNTSAAGYPHISVPAGYTKGGLPLGVSFIGTRYSDAKLLGYAYAYEQATQVRKAPRYLPTLP